MRGAKALFVRFTSPPQNAVVLATDPLVLWERQEPGYWNYPSFNNAFQIWEAAVHYALLPAHSTCCTDDLWWLGGFCVCVPSISWPVMGSMRGLMRCRPSPVCPSTSCCFTIPESIFNLTSWIILCSIGVNPWIWSLVVCCALAVSCWPEWCPWLP